MKKEKSQIGFALQGIKTEQFALFEENHTAKKETSLATALQFKLNQRNRQIGVFLNFEFSQNKKVFLKIEASCHFIVEINPWNSFIHEKENKITIPKGFLAHLAMITTGTTRGILFAKTEATPFSVYIIPTLNVAEMIPEDVSFTITAE